jgi:hypothetical protein
VIQTSTDVARLPKASGLFLLAKNSRLFLLFLFRRIGEGTPTTHALFPSFCVEDAREMLGTTRIERKGLLTFPLGIIFRLAFLGSGFFFLLARLETLIGKVHLDGSVIKRSVEEHHIAIEAATYLRLLNSSSMSRSFDFCRSCALKGGVRPLSFGWSSGVEVGKDSPFNRIERA